MTRLIFALMMIVISPVTLACASLLDHKVRTLDGEQVIHLCEDYNDKVLLIVNTASRCAYTDQYDSLEKLYSEYQDQGLVVLGFPSNDFGAQEPGTEKQIKSFCRLTYGVQFPMFSKSRVTKYAADPLYKDLAAASGRYPAWNFHKYLIGRDGKLVADYPSAVEPMSDEVVSTIKRELKTKP